MARPIDEKIVAMKMDNSDFKRKAVETTGLFGKLRDSLSKIPGASGLSKITGELGGIQKAASNTDLSSISRSVDAIAGKFSTLGIIGTTALVNIANSAVNAGRTLMSNLTTAPVMDGFREYELKMGSIQTILANTQSHGTTLDDVKKSFKELNDYADQTIYSFADMTKNIGLFTNAGLKLEESTSMIKGFSNMAAASGTNSEKAGHAAYQLSQGLSSGYLMQMDWMSLTNAGMGNRNMQTDLIAMGQAMGTLENSTKYTLKNWKSSLSDDKWLTTDVMSTYLQTMAGDIDKATLLTLGLTEAQADLMLQNAQTGEDSAIKVRTFTQFIDALQEGIGSGWAETWEIIFGDFEAATKLWTGISEAVTPIFSKQAATRNKFLKAIFDGDGLKNLFTGIKNVVTPIIQIFGALGDGFKKAFPPANTSKIKSMLEMFRILSAKMKLSGETIDNIKTIFAGFFSIFAIGWKLIKGAVAIIITIISSFSGLGAKIVELISKVAKIPIAFNKASDSSKVFNKVLGVVKKVAKGISDVLEGGVGGIVIFAEALTTAFGILATGDFSGGPWEEDSKIVDKLFRIRETVIDVVGGIQEAWSILTKGDFTGKGPWEEDSKIVDFIFKIREAIVSMGDTLGDLEFSMKPIAKFFDNFFGGLKKGFDWVVDKLSGVGNAIKNAMPTGTQLFAGGFLAGMITIVGFVLKTAWDIKQMFKGWGDVGGGIAEVLESAGGALEAFSMQVKAQALLTIAFAVGILAASFWVMSGLDSADIVKGIYAIVGSLSAIVIAMAIMTKYDITGTGFKAAVQIVALSIAFSILAGSLEKVAHLNWEELGKGILGLVGVMGAFAGAIALMSKFGSAKIGATALQFIGLAIAIGILVEVIKMISTINSDELLIGLSTIGYILLGLAGFLALAQKSKFGPASALGILGIAAAIMLIVDSVSELGEMNIDILKQGLTTIGYILLAVSLFGVITSTGGLFAASAGIVLLAGALILLLIPITVLGNMDLLHLAIGLSAVVLALLGIAATSLLMTGMLASGAGLILMAIALNMLIVPIAALGNMKWKSIIIGVYGLAVAILVLGGATALLAIIAVEILIGAAALIAIGLAMFLAGAGMAFFGSGLVALAGLTGTAVITIIAMLGTLLVGLVSLIPMGVDFVVQLVTQMVDAMIEHGPALFDKTSNLLLTMIDKINEKLPLFIEKGTSLIMNFQQGLGLAVPALIASSIVFMIQLMDGLATGISENGPKITASFMGVMGEILLLMVQTGTQMVIALFGWIPGVKGAATKIGETAEQHIRDNFNAGDAGGDKIQEFSTGITSKSTMAEKAAAGVGTNSKSSMDGISFLSSGIMKMDEAISGINSKKGGVKTATESAAKSGKTGYEGVNFKPSGTGSIEEIISGIDTSKGGVKTATASAADYGIAGFESVDASSAGGFFTSGFASGITGTGALGKVWSAGSTIASYALSSLQKKLGIESPSKEAMLDGGFFGEGFAIGIVNKAKSVGESAKGLAMTAKDSLNSFIDGFELPEEDNELHFKAVIDYNTFDPNGFGKMGVIRPDTSFTSNLVAATKAEMRRNNTPQQAPVVKESNKNEESIKKQPAVIQIVTPEKREMARWLVDDITDFQDFKMATLNQF